MAQAFTPALTVTSRQLLRRRRELPIPGDILVKLGDVVSAEQTVARAFLEGELCLVRVAESLGIGPAEVEGALQVGIAADVKAGEVIAQVRGLWGLFKGTVVSPISGTMEFVSQSTGHVGIRAAPRKLELSAYLAGTVVEVVGARSVVIEAEVAFVQGIFGVGGEQVGTVQLLNLDPTTKITEVNIPDRAPGAILIGGHSPSSAAITKARDAGAVGFITGSIDDRALRDYVGRDIGVAVTGDEDVSMTLIITEGFGSLPMGQRVWSILRSLHGARASLNGATQVRAGALRPEIVSLTPADSAEHVTGSCGTAGLVEGAKVRLIRVPFFGYTGIVEELPHDLQQIETGAWARVLKARLDDGRVVVVPRANVELV